MPHAFWFTSRFLIFTLNCGTVYHLTLPSSCSTFPGQDRHSLFRTRPPSPCASFVIAVLPLCGCWGFFVCLFYWELLENEARELSWVLCGTRGCPKRAALYYLTSERMVGWMQKLSSVSVGWDRMEWSWKKAITTGRFWCVDASVKWGVAVCELLKGASPLFPFTSPELQP